MNFISSCSLLFYFFICISSLNIRATGVKQPVRNSKQKKKKKLNTQPIPNVGKRATGVMHSETYMHYLERAGKHATGATIGFCFTPDCSKKVCSDWLVEVSLVPF